MKFGLIAGNGKFPFMVVEGARRSGVPLVVAAIREETDPAMDQRAERVKWVGIGQLGRMIRFFKEEGVEKAIMAGQVKHVQIFSRAVPDARMLKVLLKLPRRNTDSLIGAIASELESEGIELVDSTCFLQDSLPQRGTLTRREPSKQEREDINYGLEIAREIARLDLGQTIVIRGQACVAIEAMEGTDETIRRAGQAGERATDGGESGEAESGYAIRRAGGWCADYRGDGRSGCDVSLHHGREDADVRSGRNDSNGSEEQDLNVATDYTD